MAETTSGLRSILSNPLVYEIVQRIFGGFSGRRTLVERFIRPEQGDRVLDIGCGPADLLRSMPDVRYVGYDPSARYIESAREAFRSRGQFFVGRFGRSDLARHEPFDIALLTGVLHHLDDGEAADLLALLHAAIRPGGRLITLDPVFIDNQNPIARKLIEWDRGANVRTVEAYRALAAPHFHGVRETILHKALPPYTLFIMECS
ncbi:MAG: class I SAM-dependent methyltransferase [Xanthobacteraceae bacterium]